MPNSIREVAAKNTAILEKCYNLEIYYLFTSFFKRSPKFCARYALLKCNLLEKIFNFGFFTSEESIDVNRTDIMKLDFQALSCAEMQR